MDHSQTYYTVLYDKIILYIENIKIGIQGIVREVVKQAMNVGITDDKFLHWY